LVREEDFLACGPFDAIRGLAEERLLDDISWHAIRGDSKPGPAGFAGKKIPSTADSCEN
jgi:hypothetical protein